MEAAGPGVGHMGGDGPQPQMAHKGFGGGPPALHAEADHAAGPVRQILLRHRVIGVPGQPAVAHPGDLGVLFQVLRHSLPVLAVPRHTHMEALQPQVEDKGALRREHGPEVPHELRGSLGDERPAQPEPLRVSHPVVTLIRRGEPRELVRVGHPVELPAVHDGPAQSGGVAVHVLGGGVGDDVRAPLDGAAEHGRSEGVVHDKRHPVTMRSLGKFLNIQHRQRRIGDGLAEYRLGVGPEGGLQLLLRAVRGDEGELDAHPLHGDGEEVKGPPIDGAGGYHMVPAGGDIEYGVEVGCLTGGGEHPRRTALQLGDLPRHVVAGGIL